jgi:DNA invertase Pin-like site-specific DNA recombinase
MDDVLAVTKLDRLARSVPHLLESQQRIEAKGAHLKILNLGIDTATSTGKLMLTMLGGIAEFERSIMLERQREWIAKAKADGRYKGRKPTARAMSDQVRAMKQDGKGASEITRTLGVGRASVYRILGTK